MWAYRTNPLEATDREVALQVARARCRARGFVGFDLVRSAAKARLFIEVNPRLTCAYVGLSRRLARNQARDVLAMFRVEVCSARVTSRFDQMSTPERIMAGTSEGPT